MNEPTPRTTVITNLAKEKKNADFLAAIRFEGLCKELEQELSAATADLRESQARETVLREALEKCLPLISEKDIAPENVMPSLLPTIQAYNAKVQAALDAIQAALSTPPPPIDKWKAVAEALYIELKEWASFAPNMRTLEALTAYQKAIAEGGV